MARIDDGLAFMLKFENVAWYEKGLVKILDRRIYPREVKFVECKNYIEVRDAIRAMVTQSAGPYTAAGMGMALAAYECLDKTKEERLKYLQEAAETLGHSRPTTSQRMVEVGRGCIEAVKDKLDADNLDILIRDYTVKVMEQRYQRIGQVANYLVDMFPDNGKVMTQCFGETIIGMMLKECRKRNKEIKLFVPETRPFLQGGRFTATCCAQMGFDTTIITDNMVAVTMKEKKIDVFTSAADTITRDGSVINKIGTFQMAIVAKYLGIPYFVTGIPDSAKSAGEIKIEQRDPEEVLMANGIRHTIPEVKGYYPAFDITPAHLVSGVVTDKGIFSPYDLDRYKSDSYYSFAV